MEESQPSTSSEEYPTPVMEPQPSTSKEGDQTPISSKRKKVKNRRQVPFYKKQKLCRKFSFNNKPIREKGMRSVRQCYAKKKYREKGVTRLDYIQPNPYAHITDPSSRFGALQNLLESLRHYKEVQAVHWLHGLHEALTTKEEDYHALLKRRHLKGKSIVINQIGMYPTKRSVEEIIAYLEENVCAIIIGEKGNEVEYKPLMDPEDIRQTYERYVTILTEPPLVDDESDLIKDVEPSVTLVGSDGEVVTNAMAQMKFASPHLVAVGGRVNLQDTSTEALQLFVRFLVYGKASWSAETAVELLTLAKQYAIRSLQRALEEFFTEHNECTQVQKEALEAARKVADEQGDEVDMEYVPGTGGYSEEFKDRMEKIALEYDKKYDEVEVQMQIVKHEWQEKHETEVPFRVQLPNLKNTRQVTLVDTPRLIRIFGKDFIDLFMRLKKVNLANRNELGISAEKALTDLTLPETNFLFMEKATPAGEKRRAVVVRWYERDCPLDEIDGRGMEWNGYKLVAYKVLNEYMLTVLVKRGFFSLVKCLSAIKDYAGRQCHYTIMKVINALNMKKMPTFVAVRENDRRNNKIDEIFNTHTPFHLTDEEIRTHWDPTQAEIIKSAESLTKHKVKNDKAVENFLSLFYDDWVTRNPEGNKKEFMKSAMKHSNYYHLFMFCLITIDIIYYKLSNKLQKRYDKARKKLTKYQKCDKAAQDMIDAKLALDEEYCPNDYDSEEGINDKRISSPVEPGSDSDYDAEGNPKSKRKREKIVFTEEVPPMGQDEMDDLHKAGDSDYEQVSSDVYTTDEYEDDLSCEESEITTPNESMEESDSSDE